MSQSGHKISTENFAHWVNTYTDELYKWALFKTSKTDVAQDLVQDTFLSAFEKIYQFKQSSSPKTWLFKILNHKIVDYYRAKGNKQFVAIEPLEEDKANQAIDTLFDDKGRWVTMNHLNWGDENELLDDPNFIEILNFCLDDLPEKWRMTILSKYIMEKESKAICQEQNLSASNYWQIIHRAKMLLKICLENNWFKH